jgi:hypothetical protein
VDWIELAKDRAVEESCEYGEESPGSIKYIEILE